MSNVFAKPSPAFFALKKLYIKAPRENNKEIIPKAAIALPKNTMAFAPAVATLANAALP